MCKRLFRQSAEFDDDDEADPYRSFVVEGVDLVPVCILHAWKQLDEDIVDDPDCDGGPLHRPPYKYNFDLDLLTWDAVRGLDEHIILRIMLWSHHVVEPSRWA